jgi:hypothetical protein
VALRDRVEAVWHLSVITLILDKLSLMFKETDIMTIALTPLISLIAGILILLMPRLLNYIVAGYLILVGVVGLLDGSGVNLAI